MGWGLHLGRAGCPGRVSTVCGGLEPSRVPPDRRPAAGRGSEASSSSAAPQHRKEAVQRRGGGGSGAPRRGRGGGSSTGGVPPAWREQPREEWWYQGSEAEGQEGAGPGPGSQQLQQQQQQQQQAGGGGGYRGGRPWREQRPPSLQQQNPLPEQRQYVPEPRQYPPPVEPVDGPTSWLSSDDEEGLGAGAAAPAARPQHQQQQRGGGQARGRWGSGGGRGSYRGGASDGGSTRPRERREPYSGGEGPTPRMRGIRLDPEDEQAAFLEGHFRRKLAEEGVLGEDGEPTELARCQAGGDSIYLHIVINKLITPCQRWQTVLALTRDLGHHFDNVNLSTAMHRLGRLIRACKGRDPDVVDRLLAHPQYRSLRVRAEAIAGTLTPRALANFLWGMAAVGDTANRDLAHLLGRQLLRHPMQSFELQEISNAIWAFATLEVCQPEVVDHLLEGATARMEGFIPQALSNMAWGCATLRHSNPRFLEVLARSAEARLPEFQPQTLSNMLWAFSTLSIYPEGLFLAAAGELVARFESRDGGADFRAQELSNILIAYARGSILHKGLMAAFEGVMRERLAEEAGPRRRGAQPSDFTPQAMSNSLWAYAALRWYPARLLPTITRAMGGVVQLMSVQEIANSLWAFARFAYHPGAVLERYASEVERRVDEFEGQSCTNTLWAFAVLSMTHSRAFVDLLARFMSLELGGIAFQDVQYNQVLQAVLLAQFERRAGAGGASGGVGEGPFRHEIDLPEALVNRALTAWTGQQREAKLSGFHLDVSEGLKRLGVEHVIEHLTSSDLLSVDIAVIKDGRRIAIEVDGPFHFPINARTPLGHTMIRRRMLRAGGWTVLSIPWYEWYALESWEGRLPYLAEVLARGDSSLAAELQQASGDMLSTEWETGPGAPSSSGRPGALASTGGGGAWRGNVPSSPGRFVDDGLAAVLESRNIVLTKGAYRRLVSMGLADVSELPAGEDEHDGEGGGRIIDSAADEPGGGGGSGGPRMQRWAVPEDTAPLGQGRRDRFHSGGSDFEDGSGSESDGEGGRRRRGGRSSGMAADSRDSMTVFRPRYTNQGGQAESQGPYWVRLPSDTPQQQQQQPGGGGGSSTVQGGGARAGAPPRKVPPPPVRNPMSKVRRRPGGSENLPPPRSSQGGGSGQSWLAAEAQREGLSSHQQSRLEWARQRQAQRYTQYTSHADGPQQPQPQQQQPGGGTPVRRAPPQMRLAGPGDKQLPHGALLPWEVAGGSSDVKEGRPSSVQSGSHPQTPSPPGPLPSPQPQRSVDRVIAMAGQLSLAELKALCASRRLPTYGTKQALAERIFLSSEK